MTAVILLFARAALAVVLAAAAAAKTPASAAGRNRFSVFAGSLASLPFLGRPRLRRPVAAAVLVAETGSVLLLVALPGSVAGFAAAAVVLFCLTAGVAVIVGSGAKVRCHCFGATGSGVLGPAALSRNLVLTLVAAGMATITATGPTLPAPPLRLGVAALGGLAGLCVTHGGDLRWLLRPARSR